MSMKILIACEESQTVCKAFRAKGHEAYSCDILPSSGGHPEWHIQDDVLKHLNEGWDMMIAHPPCTYFANASLHYLKTQEGRTEKLKEALELWNRIWNAPVEKVAMENPIGWLNTNWKKPTQIIQPYFFGDPELKTTCLWLKGLPELKPTNLLERPKPTSYCIRKSGKQKGKKYNYYWRQSKSSQRRAKTFQGIADAMAEQWDLLTPPK